MIGFTGPYSDINFGDYAMLVNNIYALDDHDVTVFAYDRPFLETVRGRYLAQYETRMVEVRGMTDVPPEGRDHRFLTPVEILRGVTNIEEIEEAVSRLDVLYVNGGGYLNSLWAMPHRLERLLKIMVPALVAAMRGTKVVFTANGYGPFRGDAEFFAAFFGSLPHARFGTRDNILSPYWLTQAGVRAEQVTVLPDDLLFIDERLKTGGRSPQKAPYVVVETYMDTESVAQNIAHFETFARRLREDHGMKTVFLPFNVAHGGIDQGRLLAERVPDIELFDITECGFLPIEDAVAVVNNAAMVISNRYHALILALSLGVPIVSVLKDVLGNKQYYYGKNVGALQGVLDGEPHRLRDYFFTDYSDALEAIADDFTGIRDRQRHAWGQASARTGAALHSARQLYLKGER